ncbi:MAG TPA: Ig-like domain-containing protein [Gemmatimonadales bacterium]|jgi:alpha-tubulin suppressor-like RCC1 family protein
MRIGPRQIKPALAAALLTLGCGDDVAPPAPPGPVATVVVAPLAPAVAIDTSFQVSATARDSSGQLIPDVAVAWSSRDSTIVSVDSNGVLRGHAFGSATITATVNGISGSAVASVVLRWSAISAGGTYTCGITVTGVGYCWGSNATGQMGNNTVDLDPHPAPIKVAGTLRLAAIATSGATSGHTCALTIEGAAYCWGDNARGELGTHDTARALAPVAVVSKAEFAAIAVGDTHTCALSTERHVLCWGDNSAGQLGNDSVADPLAIRTSANDQVFSSVSAGPDFTCATTPGFSSYCWGGNGQGQLGIGGTAGSHVPVRTATAGLLTGVAAGRGAFTCAPDPSTGIDCWGVNSSGQLGRGVISPFETTPSPVANGAALGNVSAGLDHACAIAGSGAVWCWGAAGLLGNGGNSASSLPVQIAAPVFVLVSAGTNHTCALTADGTAYCWGRDDLGQLGTGSAAALVTAPAKVADHP